MRLCRCFLLADIWLLGTLLGAKNNHTGDEIYTGLGPQEASKNRTSSGYSYILVFQRDHKYNVAMPMKDWMITTWVLLAIYIRDQLALQAKESCPSQSLSAIRRYPSVNRVVIGHWVS